MYYKVEHIFQKYVQYDPFFKKDMSMWYVFYRKVPGMISPNISVTMSDTYAQQGPEWAQAT